MRSWVGRRRLYRRRQDRDGGAAAVELALVIPLFMLLVFGIVNYGFWFNDSVSARQGVREGARRAVVQHVSTGCTGTDLAAYACGTRAQMVTSGGTSYVMLSYPSSPGWVRGAELLVCGMVQPINVTGFVPLPTGGLIKTKTTMSIENVTPVPTGAVSFADTPPAGGDWSWCT